MHHEGGEAGDGAVGARGGAGGGAIGGDAGEPQGGAPSPTGGSTGSAGVDAGDAGAPTTWECRSDTPVGENLWHCEGGVYHRPEARACSLPARDESLLGPARDDQDYRTCNDSFASYCFVRDDCTSDADCGANAYCLFDQFLHALTNDYRYVRYCQGSCQTDADCLPTELCACHSFVKNWETGARISLGECIPATCRIDANCGGNGLCISPINPLPSWEYGSNLDAFHCRTAADECASRTECPNDSESECCPEAHCTYEEDHHECSVRETCDPC